MMRFWQTLLLGVKSLLLQKLRSALAALGIFIGTTTVIWLVAMGEGVSHDAQQQILELGATNIIVRSIEPHSSEAAGERVKTYGLTRADYRRMMSNIPTIVRAVPIRELRREFMVGGRRLDAKLIGCTSDHLALNRLQIARGRWLRSDDDRENVIVLADGTAKRLFGYEDPIGQKVRVESDVYTVIGQTKPREASAAVGGSLEARDYRFDAYIPLETFRHRVGDQIMTRTGEGFNFKGEVVELTQITLTVGSVDEVDETASIVSFLLQKYHDQEDYAVVVPKELLRQAERTRTMFNVLLVVIAGISLLVGGIGIMNIMLATVTERTREIGVRRAIGAKRSDIVQQFLAETLVLTGGGGLLGVLFGLMCGPIFDFVRNTAELISPDLLPPIVHTLEPRIALWSVFLSLFISLGVGLIFGVYPARRAAMMNPIDALRHE
ncbi:ABC transporter permease [Crateriforma conspicua]|uniref:Macrolide export ATP-binding/permease protein MacB n=1 Tax=Crateriforma conspicua TaxID=2527996 RepID=A0A5C5Y197_9PLAN|nr:ABC transporter permease [Crateriforma conspicua]QDV62813.1 Macrolide export ATP-binding/permease protein MacB [Crateriforma conspicua]TWT68423.1 Macrolide export ATP-binding/permease protein MacB [Crateriforma conspicua]